MIWMAALSTGIALALLGLLFWLLLHPSGETWQISSAANELELEELFPLHCRHLPQVRQAILNNDDVFLRDRLSPSARRAWQTNRRRVLRAFLAGLAEDFSRLEKLARSVAALSPQVDRARELEQFWLGLRFRVLYQLVALRLLLGSASLPQLERLTQFIGSLARQIEVGMLALEDASAADSRTTFSV